MTRPTGDTAERKYGALTVSERVPDGDASRIRLTRAWPKPFTSIDTLMIDRRALVPRDEALSANGGRYRYHYDGSRVTGTVTPRDSASQTYDHDFGEPVFAFNEVEVLVRALRYQPGLGGPRPALILEDR